MRASICAVLRPLLLGNAAFQSASVCVLHHLEER
jgi:hypothetical protein